MVKERQGKRNRRWLNLKRYTAMFMSLCVIDFLIKYICSIVSSPWTNHNIVLTLSVKCYSCYIRYYLHTN